MHCTNQFTLQIYGILSLSFPASTRPPPSSLQSTGSSVLFALLPASAGGIPLNGWPTVSSIATATYDPNTQVLAYSGADTPLECWCQVTLDSASAPPPPLTPATEGLGGAAPPPAVTFVPCVCYNVDAPPPPIASGARRLSETDGSDEFAKIEIEDEDIWSDRLDATVFDDE